MVWKGTTIKRLKKHAFFLLFLGGEAYGVSHIEVLKFWEENNSKPNEILGK